MSIPYLPSPPTDNLYKFAALLGAIVTIAAPAYYVTQSTELHLREVSAQQETAIYQKQTEWWAADAAASWHEVKPDKDGRIPDPTPAEQALYKAAFEKRRELELTQIKVQHAEKTVAVLRDQLQLLFWLAIAALLVGIPLSSWGFLQWHRRVQRLQDKEVLRCFVWPRAGWRVGVDRPPDARWNASGVDPVGVPPSLETASRFPQVGRSRLLSRLSLTIGERA